MEPDYPTNTAQFTQRTHEIARGSIGGAAGDFR